MTFKPTRRTTSYLLRVHSLVPHEACDTMIRQATEHGVGIEQSGVVGQTAHVRFRARDDHEADETARMLTDLVFTLAVGFGANERRVVPL